MTAPLVLGILLVALLCDFGRHWFPRGFWGLPVAHPFSLALAGAVAMLMWGVVMAAG